MKTIFTTLTACLLLTASCEKDDVKLNNLSGKWILKKKLADPGDGSGRYQDVKGKAYISFKADGSVESNYEAFGMHLLKSYTIVDSITVVFSFKDVSSQPATSYRYNFAGDTLVLRPPCIEGCGLKLLRAN